MPVKLDDREYRAMSMMVPVTDDREKLIDSEHYVEGYATTFDDPYVLYGTLKESVARNAIDGADLSDVIMQFDHEGKVLARVRNGTLVIVADDHGLRVGADLSKSAAARALYEEIEAGLIDRMSWAFTVSDERFDSASDTRHILSVRKVYDVSAVSIPANDATEISARSKADGVIAMQEQERRARLTEILKLRTRL